MTVAYGEVVDAAECGDIGHVSGGNVAFERGAEGVCSDETAGVWRREYGGREDGRCIVDKAGVRESEEKCETVGEAALDLCLAGAVVGFAAVAAVDSDIEEARIGLEKLRGADRFSTDRAGAGQLAVIGIGDRREERRALRELCGGELVEV